jgi:microcystin-dependent protein
VERGKNMKSKFISLGSGFFIAVVLIGIMSFSLEKGEAEIVVGEVIEQPSGFIGIYSGTTIPSGYLLCDGRAVSRTTYANLFKAIGTTYGAGDGSTTFNLPNLSEKVPIGKSGSYALGSTGGNAATTLTIANLPAHTHTVTPKGTIASTFTGTNATTSSNGAHTQTYSGTTSSSGNHSHTTYHQGYYTFQRDNSPGEIYNIAYYQEIASDPQKTFGRTSTNGNHNHTFSGTTASSGAHTHTATAKGTVSSTFTGSSANTSATGSGTSVTNMQPYISVNYVIKS